MWRLGELFPVQYGDTHIVLFTEKALTNMLAVYLHKPAQNGIQRSGQCTCMHMCSTASWITQVCGCAILTAAGGLQVLST